MIRIANKAPPEQDRGLTTEERALRHVALLVARGAPTQDVFTAAAEQVARIFERPWVGVMRYDSADSFVVLATWGEHPFPVGSRWLLDGPSTFEAVLRTGRPAAVSDYTGLPGTVAEAAREAGIVGGFGAPIVVDGSTWGVIAVPATRAAPVPEGAETRLGVFTELVATAISNATARDELARLAAEQAALRRIATLVARESSPVEVFVAVCEEARRILGSEAAGLLRFEPGGTATLVAQSETPWDPPPLGTSFTLDGENVVTQVFHTARAARADDWTDSTGAVAGMATVLGVRSAVAAPVIVEGRLWGTIIAATSQDEPLPGETEQRIGQFTELIATAIANAEARDARAHLVEEQAALRRVATLVAQQPSPEELFELVCVEVAHVFGFGSDPASPDIAGVVRFEPGPVLVPVGASRMGEGVVLNEPFPADELYVSSRVLRTGRSARIGVEDLDSIGGPTADWFRHHGLLTQVGSPIFVEGHLWGAMSVNSGDDFPADTEQRLERFTELIATAIANVEARDALALLANEQAALRRVATLVAVEASQDEIFNAVAVGVAGALGEELRLVRYEGELAVVVAASEGPHIDVLPVGTRLPVGGNNALSHVFRTGEPTRIDDYSKASGPIAEEVQAKGLRSIVATPIVVEGRTWGAMIVGTFGEEPVPPGTEGQLGQFAELMATSIANAEARGDLSRLLEDQAALRRVATLVADQAEPGVIFASVAEEVAQAVAGERCAIGRFEDNDVLTVIAYWSREEQKVPIGASFDVGNDEVIAAVHESGRLLRIDDHEAFSGPLMDYARTLGSLPSSTIAAPVFVGGRMWGIIFTSTMAAVLPEGTELRIVDFAELVATAIANAEARTEVERLAEQQAALRRVATLVARRDAPDLVFQAVAEEAGALLGADVSAVVRFESDDTVTVMAGPPPGPYGAGERVALDRDFVVYAVRVTGRPARFETEDPTAEGMPELVRRLGIRSALASPILVEGDLWGAMILGSYAGSFPPETEQRLDDFSELVATGISNASARAELVASRARIVAAGDDARRRIERNLHDGTQQRLIALGLDLQGVRAGIPKVQSDSRVALEAVEEDLEAILEDLRELSHGLHPPLLSRLGLGPSLQALARRSPIPVRLEIELSDRPESSIETAMYYVVSEALANAIKHSHASEICVAISCGDNLRASILDDGIGGADPSSGSGLTGLFDRVDALGGRFAWDSPPEGGTRISVELPC